MLGTRGIVRAMVIVALLLGALGGAAPAVHAQLPGTGDSDRCDPIDPAHCMFPFPNDHFTVADPTTDTGRRIDFHPLSMPRNRAGVPINPTDYNRNDGFSPGNMIIAHVPGLNSPEAFERTGAVPITDIGRYDDRDQPVVVIDAATGERHPVWSEIDSNPLLDPDDDELNPTDGQPRPQDVNLLIRPAVNFEEGHRYIVALRNMREADGIGSRPSAGSASIATGSRPATRPSSHVATTSRSRSSRRFARPESIESTCSSPGTSPSPASATSPSGRYRSATTPSPSSATATWPTCEWRERRPSSRSRA
jgi:hypothetical protein